MNQNVSNSNMFYIGFNCSVQTLCKTHVLLPKITILRCIFKLIAFVFIVVCSIYRNAHISAARQPQQEQSYT